MNKGMLEPLMIFFSLTNSPATFQSMMNELFKDLINTRLTFIYMDDILITTKMMEQHRELVKQVLQHLQDNNLFLKPKKCNFEKEQMDYLGLILKPGHITMDPIKLQGIADWPIPRNLRDVGAFLGFAGYYHHFIRNFSQLAHPLNNLTKKATKWHWDEPEDSSFILLKAKFCEAPILIQPDVHQPFRLECDASKKACGAVLLQRGEDGLWQPVAFMSRSLIKAE